MKDYHYLGDFTFSTQTTDGERFFTVVPEAAAVLLRKRRSDLSVFRLYARNPAPGMWTEIRLQTPPIKLGPAEYCWWLCFSFSGDTGVGRLCEADRAAGLPISSQDSTSQRPSDMLEFLIDGKWVLGCNAGRSTQNPDYFYLHPVDNPFFRPNPWKATPVRVGPFNGADLRYADFRDDAMTTHFRQTNFGKADLTRTVAAGPVDFTGSRFDDALCDRTLFAVPNMPREAGFQSILPDTRWPGATMQGAYFGRCSLARATFAGATFLPSVGATGQATSFEHADLKGAVFERCDLTAVDFTGADLRGAKLAGAVVKGAVLTDAWLAGADLTGVDLREARFVTKRPRFHLETPAPGDAKAKLVNAKLNADLLGKEWISLDLTGATVEQLPADLTKLDARYSDLTGRDLSGRDLTDANFSGSTLAGVKFVGAKLVRATLDGLDLTRVDFGGADLTETSIVGADLSGRDLSSVSSRGRPRTSTDPQKRTVLRRATLKAGLLGKQWTALDLTGATLQDVAQADLSGLQADNALLIEVNLSGGNFNPNASGPTEVKSSFKQTRFHGSNLTKVQMKRADLSGAQFGSSAVVARVRAPLHADEESEDRRRALERAVAAAGDLSKTPYSLRRERRSDGRWELVVYEDALPATLAGAYLAGADLRDANLEGVIANGAHMYGAADGGVSLLSGAMMSGIRLVNANLGTADLTDAHLQGANLQGANLIGAVLRRADLTPATQAKTQQAADLSGAYLAGATFTDAKLGGAVLSNAAAPTPDGIYLFGVEATQMASVQAELDRAADASVVLPKAKENLVSYLSELAASKLDLLRRALADKDVELSAGATAEVVATEPTTWRIVSGSATYTVEIGLLDDQPSLSVSPGGKQLVKDYLPTYLMAFQTSRLDILRPAFRLIGIELAGDALVEETKRQPSRWRVVDAGNGIEYGVWTRLYDLGARTLIAQPACPSVRGAFSRGGLTLAAKTRISRSATATWKVDSDSDNVSVFDTGYVTITVTVESDPKGVLSVFGTKLRIKRVGENDRLEVRVSPVTPAIDLDQRVMTDDTYCPCGQRLRDLRLRDSTPWAERWLRTEKPPEPPICIPSKMGYCPPPT